MFFNDLVLVVGHGLQVMVSRITFLFHMLFLSSVAFGFQNLVLEKVLDVAELPPVLNSPKFGVNRATIESTSKEEVSCVFFNQLAMHPKTTSLTYDQKFTQDLLIRNIIKAFFKVCVYDITELLLFACLLNLKNTGYSLRQYLQRSIERASKDVCNNDYRNISFAWKDRRG